MYNKPVLVMYTASNNVHLLCDKGLWDERVTCYIDSDCTPLESRKAMLLYDMIILKKELVTLRVRQHKYRQVQECECFMYVCISSGTTIGFILVSRCLAAKV